ASHESTSLPVSRNPLASHLTLSSLPLAAQGTVSTTVGASERRYRVHASGRGYAAHNGPQRLDMRFDRSGIQVVSGKSRLGLRLRAVGYGSSLRGLNAVPPTVSGNRVAYRRAWLTEWYANGPLGLEQGFAVDRPTRAELDGPLTLS